MSCGTSTLNAASASSIAGLKTSVALVMRTCMFIITASVSDILDIVATDFSHLHREQEFEIPEQFPLLCNVSYKHQVFLCSRVFVEGRCACLVAATTTAANVRSRLRTFKRGLAPGFARSSLSQVHPLSRTFSSSPVDEGQPTSLFTISVRARALCVISVWPQILLVPKTQSQHRLAQQIL